VTGPRFVCRRSLGTTRHGSGPAKPVGTLGPNDVVTADQNDSITDVASRLDAENVVVVTDGDQPIGIVTDRDVALSVADGDVSSLVVEDVMQSDPVTIHEDEEAIELSRIIGEHGVRRMPVVDDDGALTGIVSLDDLVATIGEQLAEVAETIEAQSPEYSP